MSYTNKQTQRDHYFMCVYKYDKISFKMSIAGDFSQKSTNFLSDGEVKFKTDNS